MSKNSKPLISIITVCYNAEKTIEQTIQSVLNQTYDNIEYIIIDGLSTDGTMDVVNRYRDKIDTIVSEKDQGIYDAMNKGIKLAHGELIGLLNADDYYFEYTVRKVIDSYLHFPEATVIYGDVWVQDDLNNFGYLVKHRTPSFLKLGMLTSHQTCFVKRSAHLRYGLYSLHYKIVSDREFLWRLHRNGEKFVSIDCKLAGMRLGGLSTKNSIEALKEGRSLSFKYSKNRAQICHYFYTTYFKILIHSMLENGRSIGILKMYRRIRNNF